jgi:hypothetical protein
VCRHKYKLYIGYFALPKKVNMYVTAMPIHEQNSGLTRLWLDFWDEYLLKPLQSELV